MTNQSQPLTLKLSNGQEVSIADAKSVLRHTENGQQRSCAIVRGPYGTAIYNADGDVEINGASSSAHWLQSGDQIQFTNGLSASVEQLGSLDQKLQSLLDEPQPATPVNTPQPEATIVPAPEPSVSDQDVFRPATAAASYSPEPAALTTTEPAAQEPAATKPAAQEPANTITDLAIPAATAATLAALGVATVATETSAEPATPSLQNGFTPVIAEPVAAAPVAAAPVVEAPVEPATEVPATGFAAELLARIQAEDNNEQQYENAFVSEPTSEAHSPLAADDHSLSLPAEEPASISSLIPELPSTTAAAPSQNDQPAAQPESLETTPTPVETTTAESAERQMQSSSVSALLERMKSEGKWGGLSEEEEAEEVAAVQEASVEAPVLDETEEDVQSYMSQLLSRMRDPNDAPRAVAPDVAATQQPAQATPEVVEVPKPVGLLKPEEYIPKTKAKRLDSLQDMRALANTQTRTAIDRSQAKRNQESLSVYNLAIAVGGGVVAVIAFLLNYLGHLSILPTLGIVGLVALVCVGLYFGKTILGKRGTTTAAPAAPQQVAQVQQHQQPGQQRAT